MKEEKEERFIYLHYKTKYSEYLGKVDMNSKIFDTILMGKNIKISKGVYLENGVIIHDNVNIGDNVRKYAKYSGFIKLIEEDLPDDMSMSLGTHIEVVMVDPSDKTEGYKLTIGRDTVVHSGVNIFQ